MRPLFYVIILSFLNTLSAYSQQVQWASEVLSYSSQYGEKQYSAQQVLGVPNGMTDQNRGDMAWVPKRTTSNSGEYIEVGFEEPMKVQQVAVAESLNPGAIYRIYLYDEDGKKHRVYQNKHVKFVMRPFRMFRTTFAKTPYKVKGLRLELKTKAVKGSNQIDAIAISDSKFPIKVKIVEDRPSSQEDGARYKIENLGPNINSSASERLPIISPDGLTLFFARKDHNENMGHTANDDIWFAKKDSRDGWLPSKNIGSPLNNTAHNFVVATDVDGQKLYLAGDYSKSSGSGLSYTTQRRHKWKKPRAYTIKDNYNESPFVGYYVHPEGTIMMYSVERDEGMGNRDIYVSFRTGDKTWSKPKNLGKTINTVGDESSVFLALDGKTLYFSSNGHPGYGGYDMYISKRIDDSWTHWSQPINMGAQINSSYNEYNYSIPASGDWAYFASEKSVYGGSDLYRIELPPEFKPDPVVLVSGRLVDLTTGNPFRGNLKVKHRDKKRPSDIETNEDGRYSVVVPFGDDVSIYGQLEGYYVVNENVNLSKEKEDLDGDISTTNRPVSKEKKAEINKLEALLNGLKKKLIGTQVERDSPEEEVVDVPSTKQIENIEKSTGLQKIKDKYKKRQKQSNTSSESEEELARLKEKYNQPEEDKLTRLKKKYKDFLAGNETGSTSASPKNKTKKKPKPKTKRKKRKPFFEFDDDADEEVKEEGDEIVFDEEMTIFDEEDNPSMPTDKKDKKTSKKIKKKEEDEIVSSDEEVPEAKNVIKEKMPEVVLEEESPLPSDEKLDEDFERYKEQYIKYLTAQLAYDIKGNIYNNEINGLYRDRSMRIGSQYNTPLAAGDKKPIVTASLETLTFNNGKRKEKAILAFENSVRERDKAVEKELEEFWRPILKKELKKSLRNPTLKEMRKELDYRIRHKVNQKLKRKLKEKQDENETLASNMPVQEKEKPLEVAYKEIEKDIYVIPIKEGQVIQLNNVFFEANKASLKTASTEELDRVFEFMSTNDHIAVEIRGHTNGLCSHEFANKLSDERAKTIVDYLIKKGINPKRMIYHGYGKTQPIASNDNAEGRRKNQRVELKIVKVE